MGALIVGFCIVFGVIFYFGEKNDEIWKDETLKELFPKSNTIHIKFYLIMGYFMLAGAIVLEVKYNGRIPMFFFTMLLEDWIFVVLLIWNHRDNKKSMKHALIYGIISSIFLIILYKSGKFKFKDLLK